MSHAPPELTWVAALLLGLLGSVHCFAMCGGIASAFAQRAAVDRSLRASLLTQILYSTGRIASYGVAGALAGAFGWGLAALLGMHGGPVLRIALGCMMILAGLYLLGRDRLLLWLERGGQRLWKRISPLSARISAPEARPRPWQMLALGAVWGWLPCGLVYAALASAATTGSALHGALLMLCFGMGTVPALVAAGTAASRLQLFLRRTPVRYAAGSLVTAFGAWTVLATLAMHTSAM